MTILKSLIKNLMFALPVAVFVLGFSSCNKERSQKDLSATNKSVSKSSSKKSSKKIDRDFSSDESDALLDELALNNPMAGTTKVADLQKEIDKLMELFQAETKMMEQALHNENTKLVMFEHNSSDISKEDKSLLAKVASDVANSKHITIKAHSDIGEDDFATVAAARGEAVKQELLKLGAPASKIDVQVVAANDPVSYDLESKNNIANRRVTFNFA